MSRKYSATVPASVIDPDDGDGELEVLFTFTPGEPETGPTYDCGGTPATGPEFEINCVVCDCCLNEHISANDADDDKIANWLSENWEPYEPDPDEPDYN